MKPRRASQPGNGSTNRHRWWLVPRSSAGAIPLLALLAVPAVADASPTSPPPVAVPDTSAASPIPPVQVQGPTLATTVLMRIRESTHRILEPPDLSILRYTIRYPISAELAEKIVEIAVAEDIDPELAFRLVRVESRFQPRARSPQGALGLTQLMPSTARGLDRSLRSEADILEPRTNLQLGFRYLSAMLDRYGDVRLALLAYNRGPVAVDRALRAGRDPENGYSRKVLGTRPGNRYQGNGRPAASN